MSTPEESILDMQLTLARMEKVPEQLNDHEDRLRVLEKGMIKLAATLSVTGAIGAAVGSALMKVLVG